MKTAKEIKAMQDDSWVDGYTGTVVGIYPPKKVGRGMLQNCKTEDDNGDTIYVVFSGKNNANQPTDKAGSRLTVSGNGIKFRKDAKNADGKYDQIMVGDAATIQFNGGSPPVAAAQTQQASRPVQSTENPKQVAEKIIKEWIQIRKWIQPIIEEAGLPVDRELVTSVLMGLQKRGIVNIPIEGETVEWRSVVINKKPLGEWPVDKLADLVIMVMRGDSKLDKVKDALLQAKIDSNLTNIGLLEHVTAKSAVSQEAYANVLLGRAVAYDNVTEEQAGELVSDPKFPDELKEKYEQLLKSAESGGDDVVILIED